MTDIHDLDLDHLKKFLMVNGKFVPKHDEQIYEIAFDLMRDKITVYHNADISILQWMLAYNALKRKAIDRLYTESEINSLSDIELSKLAKKLDMKKVNIDNIISVLKYMNKFYTKAEPKTITGIYDLDKILLLTIDPKELSNLSVNDYTKKIINDQNFWKERLRVRLGLTTNTNVDYKHITKMLDNGKSFEENYQSALENESYDIIDILLENDVVMVNKPNNLLNDFTFDINELGNIKNYTYDDFIKYLIDNINKLGNELDKSYFDKKVYTGDAIIIELQNIFFDAYEDDRDKEMITYVFKNKNGFTNGEILYELAQKIPNEEEIKMHNIEMIRKHSDEILENIKDQFRYLEKRIQYDRNYDFVKDYDHLKKYYNVLIISQLLKDPIKFLEYNKKHPNLFAGDYNSIDFWGHHIYWEGLSYYGEKYHVNLGS